MWTITTVGWIVAAGLTRAYAPRTSWWFVVCVIPCVVLAFRTGFPNRRLGLMLSWVGPLAVTLTYMIDVAVRGLLTADTLSVVPAVVPIAMWDVSTILVMIWLWRGYGAIPLLSGLSIIVPHRYGLEKAALEYPYHRWWTVPLFFVALMTAKLGLVTWWLRSA